MHVYCWLQEQPIPARNIDATTERRRRRKRPLCRRNHDAADAPPPFSLSTTTGFEFLSLIKDKIARENANRSIQLNNYAITFINDGNNNNRNNNAIHCIVIAFFINI